MAHRMKAVRKPRAEKGLEVVEVQVPQIGPQDVLVAVEAASICGTDLHIYNWDAWSRGRVKPPLTLGHEFAGTVVETGAAVLHVKEGDYVSAESHITCGMCFQCRTGSRHMCPQTQILGVDRDGAFAEYVALPEQVIWQNDRSRLRPEIATLQEPFGNAVFATLAHDLAGASVAVLGCGPIGLFSIGIARASGAARVLAVDLNDYRLALAKAMGAEEIFNPRTDGYDGDTAAWIVEANEGFGVDIMLEMSGAPQAINAAFRGVRNGGRVTLFGIPSDPVKIDVAENMIFKNLTVLALNGRRIFDTWFKTRWLLESGVVNLRPLVTREMDMERIEEAMEMLSEGAACKIILRPNGRADPRARSAASRATPDANVRGLVVHP